MGACPSKEDGPTGTSDDTGPPPTGPTGAPPPPPKCDFKIGDTVKHKEKGYTGVVESIDYGEGDPAYTGDCMLISVKQDGTDVNITATPDELEKYTPTGSDFYFEFQKEAESCGRHAINNMVGKLVYTNDYVKPGLFASRPKIDFKNPVFPYGLPNLCDVLEEEARKIGMEFDIFECQGKRENYDANTMMAAVRLLGFKELDEIYSSKNSLDRFLGKLGTDGFNYALVNKGFESGSKNRHWVSIRIDIENGKYYYFDSLVSKEEQFVTDNLDRFKNTLKTSIISDQFDSGFLFKKLTSKPLDPLKKYRELAYDSKPDDKKTECEKRFKNIYTLLNSGKYEQYDIIDELLDDNRKEEFAPIREELFKELGYRNQHINGKRIGQIILDNCKDRKKDNSLDIRVRTILTRINNFKQGGKRKTYRKKSRSSKKTIRKH